MDSCFVVIAQHGGPEEQETAGVFSTLDLAKAAVELHLADATTKHEWLLENDRWLYLDDDNYAMYAIVKWRVDYAELWQGQVVAPVVKSEH